MRTIADDTEVILAAGVFHTYGSASGYGNCQSIGEPGWVVGKRWWIHGSGIGQTTLRLVQLCKVPGFSTDPNQYNGALVYVIGTPYYQDNSDSIVSDLTVDGNYPASLNNIFAWKENIGAVSLNGSRCTIRNVKGINLYGWAFDPSTGRTNGAEDFVFVIANPRNPQTGVFTLGYGNLIENSEVASSGGTNIDAFNFFTGVRQTPPPLQDESAAGLPAGIMRKNICRDFPGVSCFGGLGKGIVVDSNRALNSNDGIRSDTGWVLDLSVTNNFFSISASAVTLSADGDAIFRRGVIAHNTFQANDVTLSNAASSPWVISFKQSPGFVVENMLIENNRFLYHDLGSHLVPSALVLEGTTPGPQNIQMIDNVLDPIYLMRGKNCPGLDEPLCQIGLSTPTYSGSGNVTTSGLPVTKLNRTIPPIP
jgi:hypothetical protein